MANTVAITETYEDVERLICKTVWDFIRRYGGDFDELLSEANIGFLKAYDAFDSTKGQFSTLLVVTIWRRLCHTFEIKDRERHRGGVSLDSETKNGPLSTTIAAKQPRRFSLDEFTEGFADDAKYVLNMILNAPSDFEMIVNSKGGEARNWRSSLKSHLYDIGWTATRIAETFQDIAAALS